jgi:hypothetical protein
MRRASSPIPSANLSATRDRGLSPLAPAFVPRRHTTPPTALSSDADALALSGAQAPVLPAHPSLPLPLDDQPYPNSRTPTFDPFGFKAPGSPPRSGVTPPPFMHHNPSVRATSYPHLNPRACAFVPGGKRQGPSLNPTALAFVPRN